MNIYGVCNQFDNEIFIKQCKALEKRIPALEKQELLHDVDDSKTQIYKLGCAQISVHNSRYLNEVYIESGIDLTKFFK